jgi:hypothetical protein
MPEISRFFGIVISMFYNDHPPAALSCLVRRQPGSGRDRDARSAAPPRVLGMITEWAALHREELRANWKRAQSEQPLEPIAPLE